MSRVSNLPNTIFETLHFIGLAAIFILHIVNDFESWGCFYTKGFVPKFHFRFYFYCANFMKSRNYKTILQPLKTQNMCMS